MIKSFTITNYLGDSIKLELSRPEQSGLLVKSVTGLGPVKANINMTDISTSDGARYNSSRLESRNIVFDILYYYTGAESIEDLRHKSYKYFPLKHNVEIKIETSSRVLVTTGYVESNEPEIFSNAEGTQVSIVCPDPYLYSTDYEITEFFGVEPEFQFPFANDSLSEKTLVFGTITSLSERVLEYPGDAETGLTMQIHVLGEVSNITIKNLSTNETIYLNTSKIAEIVGSELKEGDDVIITTSKGDKGIYLRRDGEYYNILNCLSRNSPWFKLRRGDNIFSFTAEQGFSNLQFTIMNKILYEGI